MPLHLLLRLTAPRRRFTEWLLLAAGLLSSGLILAGMVWNERHTALEADAQRMQEQAQVIDKALHRQLEAVRWSLDGSRAALGPGSSCGRTCRLTLLQSLKRAMPGVRALLALGPDGRIELSDDDLGERRLDDRRFLSRLAHMCSGDTLYLSDPFESQPDRFDIKVAMSLSPTDGCGHGAIVAILNPEYFDAVMRSALYATDMTISISDVRGRRLLYVPPNPAEMRAEPARLDPLLAAHRAAGRLVTVQRASDAAGVERLVVQRSMQLGDLGMERTLIIGLARNAALIGTGWRTLALASLAGWALFWLVCAAALLLAQRRRRALEALAREAEAERLEAAERVELALTGASLGLWDWHIPSGRRTIDARACAILGYTSDEQEAEDGDGLARVHPEDRDALHQAFERHLHGSTPDFEAEFRMRHRNGHWVWVQSRGRVVERDAAGNPLRMVGTRCDISARKQAEADIAHLAFYDGLTNLPNRRLLMDRLGHALAKCERNGGYGAVLFIDLDNFKLLNDTRGHDVGDRLLEMVAFRLQQVTRDIDTVARLGGDEFVLLLEDLGTTAVDATEHAELVARKILNALSLAYTLEGQDLRSTPSIGAALFGNAHHVAHDLLRQADMAMYEAKSAGGGAFRFFDPGMQAAVDATTSLETDLRFALARREFELWYQPVVNQMGLMTGAEALIRWRHPRNGLTGPGAFIAQAEKSGLIVGIGDWVLQEACRQLRQWARDPATAGLTVSVNVSARQFRQEDFVARVLEILAVSGADPRRLKIELTETVLLTDIEDTIVRMQALKQHGIGFSLDDFGTGYSSLSYLQRLPLDQLKIDQSFVRDMLRTPHAASIVQAIVNLSGTLGLHVVAEGVETEEQWERLREIGCLAFQGYLFARPMAPADMAALHEERGDARHHEPRAIAA
ncbi:bifunctional diguanylate cyclase/phosphodiesterase [uncultured Massilia sp.]|uniref:putative bifunctional diguanylate cyclase/phosphodiesterase n=1 Tax=uncultured Massilia sp. TaxID=169973 RepID=UPI0025E389C5|nr:GGDEF and EAL domain-containing protein [uncultured Massilia sp.]